MESRYTINQIMRSTRDWTCKVQVVDKIRPKISKVQRTKYQTIIVQDENEDQICIVVYGTEIPHYDNLFQLFHTYLISTARVRDPSAYAIPMNIFEWVIDTFTIVEEVKENNEEGEEPLPLPTRLNTVSFVDIEKQVPGTEFDLLAVVANCGSMKYYETEEKRCQEAILIDDKKRPFLFTIWGELADNEGAQLQKQLQEYPVILAKRIAVSNFKNEIRLTTRFNSTILINPLYPQATKLINWTKDNKQLLIAYTQKSSSESFSTLNLAPFEDKIISISEIQSESTAQTFYVEGEISLPNEFQYFFVLLCSECKHLVRIKRKKIIQCINCKLHKMLIPRCEFEVEITDASGTITATVQEKLAERMLSMTADQIYETTVVKKQLMPVEHIREELLQKWFKIHLQKSLLWTPDRTPGSLVILSYSQKQTMFDLPQISTPVSIGERSKRKIGSISSTAEYHASSTEEASPGKKSKIEVSTPTQQH